MLSSCRLLAFIGTIVMFEERGSAFDLKEDSSLELPMHQHGVLEVK